MVGFAKFLFSQFLSNVFCMFSQILAKIYDRFSQILIQPKFNQGVW
jgi:hypothetical protein